MIRTHVVGFDHLLDQPVEFFTLGARRQRNVARMQGHVSALDAFGRQRPQRTEILCQPDCNGNFRQFLSTLDT